MKRNDLAKPKFKRADLPKCNMTADKVDRIQKEYNMKPVKEMKQRQII